MKLKDWAKKEGISYQTAYRWFKSRSLPVKAYQSESGTIIVQDEEGSAPENTMNRLTSSNSDAMSVFLKKTVEFSKANYSIEDFAAYVIGNFQLKINPAASDMSLKYSKNKPSQNEVNKHFQQFIKPKHFDKQELVNSFPENTETWKKVVENDPELKELVNINYSDPVDNDSIKNFVVEATSSAFTRPTPTSTLVASSTNTLGATFSTNQSVSDTLVANYSSPTALMSSVQASSVVPTLDNIWVGNITASSGSIQPSDARVGGNSFQPTPRELQSFRNFTEANVSEENESSNILRKSKRGRPKKIVK